MVNTKLSDLPASSAVDYVYGELAGVSKKITPVNVISSGGIILTNVHVSSAQLLAINDAPIEILPAPGAGKFYVVVCVSAKYNFGGSIYSGGSNFEFYYGTVQKLNSGGGTFIGGVVAGADVSIVDFSLPYFGSGGDIAVFENSPLNLYATTNFTNGNGTLDVQILYYVIPLA